MPDSSSSINLVKDKQIPFFDRFMNWILTIGRVIVILTEIIAISAFIYRFSLDERLVDLHDAIKQKQTIISLLKTDENKYRNLQDRIALAETFSEKSIKTNKVIADIVGFLPQEIITNDLRINKDRVSISINIFSISQLTDFINTLKNYPEIKSISIDNIENNPAIGLSADISASLR